MWWINPSNSWQYFEKLEVCIIYYLFVIDDGHLWKSTALFHLYQRLPYLQSTFSWTLATKKILNACVVLAQIEFLRWLFLSFFLSTTFLTCKDVNGQDKCFSCKSVRNKNVKKTNLKIFDAFWPKWRINLTNF